MHNQISSTFFFIITTIDDANEQRDGRMSAPSIIFDQVSQLFAKLRCYRSYPLCDRISISDIIITDYSTGRMRQGITFVDT